MNFNSINTQKFWMLALCMAALSFLTYSAMAADDHVPEGINLSKLYDKFKQNSADETAEGIMMEDFNAAEIKGKSPSRLFTYAQKGNPVACNLVGYLFDEGKGVKRDPAKAIKWFSYCAGVNGYAAYNLALIYLDGRGIAKDEAKAVPYLQQAWVLKKIPQAGIRLAYYYKSQKNWNEEWDWLLKLEHEKAYARHWGYLMGDMMIKKTSPIYDPQKIVYVLNKATEEYSSQGAGLLAYAYGIGIQSAPSKMEACQYDMLSGAFAGQRNTDARTWVMKLDSADISACRVTVDHWLSTHNRPPALDFKSMMYDAKKF